MERQIHRRMRRRRAKVLSISFVSVAALALSIIEGPKLAKQAFEAGSTMLRLEQVQWVQEGNTNLSKIVTPDVLWRASGLEKGREMFKIDLDELERKLLELPWLESVQIQKKLPSTLLVRFSVHHARALGLKKGIPWSIGHMGEWIAPVSDSAKANLSLDLPLLVSDKEDLSIPLQWLEELDKEFRTYIAQIHEVNHSGDVVRTLLDLKYASQSVRTLVIGAGTPGGESFTRLKRVVQYLIKNNILVSAIDLRAGKKVVVNVGKRP